MNVVQGSGEIVPEPDWRTLLTDDSEIASAGEHWRRITTEMRGRNILSPSNGHALQRLIIAYALYDRCSREVAKTGAVSQPKRGVKTAIARLSPHFTAMREAASDASQLEAELGLSPRRRSSAAKVEGKVRSARASDQYLKPVVRAG